MENPDLVLQETGSSLTHSRFNHVPSGDTLRRDAMSSFEIVLPFYFNYGKVIINASKWLSNNLNLKGILIVTATDGIWCSHHQTLRLGCQ